MSGIFPFSSLRLFMYVQVPCSRKDFRQLHKYFTFSFAFYFQPVFYFWFYYKHLNDVKTFSYFVGQSKTYVCLLFLLFRRLRFVETIMVTFNI